MVIIFSQIRTVDRLAESIPKEAPWKTSALSKQPFMGCELSTVTSGTERKRGFVGISPSQEANLFNLYS